MYKTKNHAMYYLQETVESDHLCGLVVRIPAYRSTGPGSIQDATRFCEK
jgi:hypothetical protein